MKTTPAAQNPASVHYPVKADGFTLPEGADAALVWAGIRFIENRVSARHALAVWFDGGVFHAARWTGKRAKICPVPPVLAGLPWKDGDCVFIRDSRTPGVKIVVLAGSRSGGRAEVRRNAVSVAVQGDERIGQIALALSALELSAADALCWPLVQKVSAKALKAGGATAALIANLTKAPKPPPTHTLF